MARPNLKEERTNRVQEHLREILENPGDRTEIRIKDVCAELDLHRSVIDRYGLSRDIQAASLALQNKTDYTSGPQTTLQKRIKELEAERDEWRRQAEETGRQIAYVLYNAALYNVGDPNDLFKPPPV